MDKLVKQLKNMKNATQAQYKEAIDKYAYSELIKDLKDAGIDKDDLLDDEFNELLQEKIKQSSTFAKGAMVATGAMLFLELLG
jgi:hypothetical protein